MLQLNLIVDQLAYEADILYEIIQNARLGLIHPSLLSQEQLLNQFKDIKLGLPSGTDLPLDIDITSTNDLLRLSDLAVYYSNNNIVFVIIIPLIYQNEFTLYNLIPKPVCMNKNCIYVKPSTNFLAISKSK